MKAIQVIEAETPKAAMRRMLRAGPVKDAAGRFFFRTEGAARLYIDVDEPGSSSPVLSPIFYDSQEQARDEVGQALYHRAIRYLQGRGHQTVRVMANAYYSVPNVNAMWIRHDEPGHPDNFLINVEGVTNIRGSGEVRYCHLAALHEAESPKRAFQQAKQHYEWTMDDIKRALTPHGFVYQGMGCRCMEKRLGNKLYAVGISTNPARALVCTYYRTQSDRWQHDQHFVVPYNELMTWLSEFGLVRS